MMYSACKLNKQVAIYTLDVVFSQFGTLCCSMPSTNCCFFYCIQVSQEAGKIVFYSHLLKNFPQFAVVYLVKDFSIVSEAEVDAFSGILLLFL